METRKYYYRGLIESVTSKGRGTWLHGYSAAGPNGGALQPWMGKRACYAEARRDGVKAVFVESALYVEGEHDA